MKRLVPDMRRAAVYRCYDRVGTLLYVGCSVKPDDRLAEHAGFARWWDRVSRITHDWYPTWPEAHEAEKAAIHDEKPLHNAIRYVVAARERGAA